MSSFICEGCEYYPIKEEKTMEDQLAEALTTMVRKIVRDELICKDKLETDEDKIRKAINKKVNRAGLPWNIHEDRMLDIEIKAALEQIAKNHRRSIGAIRSRVNYMMEKINEQDMEG